MRLTLIILFTILLSASALPQEKLTLEKAVSIALNRNTTLLKSNNQLESFHSGVQSAYGNFLPSLDASAGWRWTKTDQQGLYVDPNTGQVVDGSQQLRSYNVGVGTDWVLFDGLSNLATLSKSKDDLESAQFTLERLKQDIVYQTMTLYYDVVYNSQLLNVKKDDLKWNEKNLETIKERNRLGAATLADVYQQEVAKGNAELELIRTENRLETAKKDLLYYLGIDVLEEFAFTDTLTTIDSEILNSNLLSEYQEVSELVSNALQKRYDYQSATLNFESSKEGVSIAQGGHWPSLVANGSYSWFGSTVDEIDKNRQLQFGLLLRLPIFEGWSVSDRVQIAEVQSKNSEIELNDLERQIKKEIKTNFLDLQAAQKGLVVSEKNIAAARENLNIEAEKYSLGSGKLLDVLIANSRYTTAQTDLLNSQFAFIVLSQQLKYNLGILDYKNYEQ
jgi:outer membrane protein